MTQAPFIVFSLPRSRSAWIARFLSYGGKRCGHDLAPRCATMKEFADLVSGEYVGTAETGAVIGWRAIRRLLPDARIAVVRRPVQEVYESLARFGLGSQSLMDELIERDTILHHVAKLPGVRSFRFADLNNVTVCQELFEFCLGVPFDWEWWESLANVNVQVDVAEQIKYLTENRSRIETLKADARRIEQSGVVIGPEPWDSVWPEVDALFAEHFAEVDGGDEPDRPYRLDEPTMRQANAIGQLRIVTARVDGALAGYCMWQISKDVESAGATFAEHGPWFVRPQFAALMLGPKLFDASLDDLHSLGVRMAYPHHRLRGRGAKLGAFFRRRGAIEIQHTYSLRLTEPSHA
jgi:hypothetical protein